MIIIRKRRRRKKKKKQKKDTNYTMHDIIETSMSFVIVIGP